MDAFTVHPITSNRLTAPYGLVRAALQSSLLRNSYALMLNAAITAVLGLAFWFFAARLFSPAAIGLGGTVISTIIYVSNISQLNFGTVLVRFLPGSGAAASRLIWGAYGIGVLASVVFASAFLLVTDRFLPRLDIITSNTFWAVLFVTAVALWTVFALQDDALAGRRQSIWVAVSKTAYAVLKIGALFIFAAWTTDWSSIVAAWMAPVVLFVLAVNWLIFSHILPRGRSSLG
jgi:O-antigen/teichoic acid export membrane protein